MNERPALLDLFCCEGGACAGYMAVAGAIIGAAVLGGMQ